MECGGKIQAYTSPDAKPRVDVPLLDVEEGLGDSNLCVCAFML